MADANWTKKLGATPGRLGVVALLAIALVAVLLFQVGGSSAPASTSLGPRDVRRKPRLPEKPPSSVSAAQTAIPHPESAPAPKITLEDAIHHDPFALVGTLAQLAAVSAAESNITRGTARRGQSDDRDQRIKQAVSAVRNKGVQMVLLGKGEKLAIVGDRPVRIGDMLEGLQVVSITPQGITLSEQDDKRP